MKTKISLVSLVVGLTACLLAPHALADARGHGARTVTIRAGVVVLNNALNTRDWHTFYAMDQRLDLKPLGWSFENPNARPGLEKWRAAYWAVNLNTLTSEQIQRYHILLLSNRGEPGGGLQLNVQQREKLRRFVDGGGILWLDTPSESWTRGGSILFPDVNLDTTPGGGTPQIVDLNHPLFRGYYNLSAQEVLGLGLAGRGIANTNARLTQLGSPPLNPQVVMGGITGTSARIASSIYGSGRVVASAVGISGMINQPFSGIPEGDSRYRALVALAPSAELKFAYNMVRWASTTIGFSKDARQANAAFDRYGAPLSYKWYDESSQSGGGQNVGSPVIYNGFVYVLQGRRLICYDGSPQRDADGDGFNDDGIPDLALGSLADVVWTATVPGDCSSPIIIETPRAGALILVNTDGGVVAYKAVPRDNNGRLTPINDPLWIANVPTGSASPTRNYTGAARVESGFGRGIAQPVYMEGMLIVPARAFFGNAEGISIYALAIGDGTTRPTVMTGEPFSPTGDAEWEQPTYQRVSRMTTPFVAGIVPNYGRGGGNDLMLYFGGEQIVQGSNTTLEQVSCIWLGAKGEKLEYSRASQSFTTRLKTNSGSPAKMFNTGILELKPRVYEVDANGNVLRDLSDDAVFNIPTPGELKLTSVPIGVDGNPIHSYYIDYFVDWANAQNAQTMFRTTLSIPASNQAGLNFQFNNKLRGLTLGSNGVLYITTATQFEDPQSSEVQYLNGALIAVLEQRAEQNRDGSRILWRWNAQAGYPQLLEGNPQPVPIPPSLRWNDPDPGLNFYFGRFLDFTAGFAGQPPLGTAQTQRDMFFQFVGSPVYSDGTIYALGVGKVRIFNIFTTDYYVLLAFDADPPSIAITDPQLTGLLTGTVTISQVDYERGGRNQLGLSVSTTYDPSSPNSNLKFESGQLRFYSMYTGQQGANINLMQSFSLSQPVAVKFGSGSPYLVPNTNLRYQGTWDNLLWFAVFFGKPKGLPTVIGDLAYIPQSVTIPRQARGQFSLTTRSGIVGISSNPKREQPTLARGGQVGLFPSNFYESALRWPYVKDLPELSDNPFELLSNYFLRITQEWPEADNITPLAFGEGLLTTSISGGNNQIPTGFIAYERNSTMIADQGRVLEVDKEGSVIWSTENSQLETISNRRLLSIKTPISSTGRIVRVSQSEFWMVDTANDRLVLMDRAGNEIRSLTGFIPDSEPNYAANGALDPVNPVKSLRDPARSNLLSSNWVSGTPTGLRLPTDVTVWTEFVQEDQNPYLTRNALEYWVHYTIADSGNFRLIDLVDRYVADPLTLAIRGLVVDAYNRPQVGVLYWMSPTNKLGQEYRYVGAQRFEYRLAANQPARVGYASIVQNVVSTGSDLNLDPKNVESGMVILQTAENGRTVLRYGRKMRLPDGQVVPILSPISISTSPRSIEGNPGIYVLLCTTTGIYELQPVADPNAQNADTWDVTWMLTNEQYSNVLRRRYEGDYLSLVDNSLDPRDVNNPLQEPLLFKPLQAKQLANGNVLIVNGYVGSTWVRMSPNGQTLERREFLGEVFELRARDFFDTQNGGLRNESIIWSTADNPKLSGSYPIRMPTSADRQ